MSGGFSVTGQVARGFRDPTLSDRYYRGPTGRGFVTGNPDLDPEASLQFDVAARHTAARVRTAAYFYRYRISDLIERYQAAPDFFHLRNSGAAVVSGFEVEGQADLGRGWSLDVAAQLVEGRAQDDDADLDDIPPANVSVVLRRQFSSRGFAQARVAAFAEDDHPGPTERSVPGYVLLDAAAGASIAKSLEVRINSRNLLNQTYFASQDTRAVLAPGRSVSVTLAIRF
jgi:outer membrane receptor protein involved in Fe transport